MAGENSLFVNKNGNYGIGTTEPRTPLHVLGRISTGADFTSPGSVTFFPGDGYAWFHIDNGPKDNRPMGRLRFSYGGTTGDNEVMSILQNGNVGIGTSAPQSKLHVNGDVLVSGDIFLPGADCAENFNVQSLLEAEPGTVMVINAGGNLEPSSKAYDKRVAGVISGAGQFRPGIILDKSESDIARMPIAISLYTSF